MTAALKLTPEQLEIVARDADAKLAEQREAEAARQQAEKSQKQDEAREAERRETIAKLEDERDSAVQRAEQHCRAMVGELQEVRRLSDALQLLPESVDRHLSEKISGTFKLLTRSGRRFGKIDLAGTWRKPDAPWLDTPPMKPEKEEAE